MSRLPAPLAAGLNLTLALALALPPAPARAEPVDCVDAVAAGEDSPCQLQIGRNRRTPFAGVLLSPAASREVTARLAGLETALDEQKALTAKARGERDAAREESRQVITDLLETGQRMERANADLVRASAALDNSNRELAAAVEAMPTRLTLILAGTLIAAAAFGAGYGIAKLTN